MGLWLGVTDTRRLVYEEPTDSLRVGATRGQSHIDHILLGQPLGDLVKAVFMTPVGWSDHEAVIAKICPTICPKPSNVWRFPPFLLQSGEFFEGQGKHFSGNARVARSGMVGTGGGASTEIDTMRGFATPPLFSLAGF